MSTTQDTSDTPAQHRDSTPEQPQPADCHHPEAQPNYNQQTGQHDQLCPTCFYGEAA